MKSKAAWRTIGGKRNYYRSMWEANYARYLEFLKQRNEIGEWIHEPKTFWFEGIKRGVCSYKPDFRVYKYEQIMPNTISRKDWWIEVKGYMDSKSATKIKRFKKYFPQENLIVIDKKWFAKNNSTMRALIPEWEGDNQCHLRLKPKKKPLSMPIGLVLARRNANRYLQRAR